MGCFHQPVELWESTKFAGTPRCSFPVMIVEMSDRSFGFLRGGARGVELGMIIVSAVRCKRGSYIAAACVGHQQPVIW